MEYAKFVLKKVVLGDFSDEAYTPDALALSIALGTSGLDIPMDVRDLAASIADISQNGFDKDNSLILALNLLALLPAVGAVKYADDVGEVGKRGKFEDVFDLADSYNLSNATYNNHILDRHGPNSLYGNKSHFNADFDIRNGIDSTLKGKNFIIKSNTAGKSGYIFEQSFSEPIGINSKGKLLYTIKVVIDEYGNVVTAFPKK